MLEDVDLVPTLVIGCVALVVTALWLRRAPTWQKRWFLAALAVHFVLVAAVIWVDSVVYESRTDMFLYAKDAGPQVAALFDSSRPSSILDVFRVIFQDGQPIGSPDSGGSSTSMIGFTGFGLIIAGDSMHGVAMLMMF